MKILIWDFNGTILDDTKLCLSVANQMLKKRCMKTNYTIEEYKELFCFPVKKYYQKMGYTFKTESFEDVSVEFHDKYDTFFEQAELMDGFLEKIEEAKRKGYINIILSASRQDRLISQCAKLGITKYFEKIFGIHDLLASSKIDMAVSWFKEENINPNNCIYIGDTLHDVEVASTLKIKNCVLVASGHQSERILKKSYHNVVLSLHDVKL